MGEDGLGDVMCLSARRAFRSACSTAFRTILSLSAWVSSRALTSSGRGDNIRMRSTLTVSCTWR
ncbi:unnamed protein product [Ectocarpus sp. 8 AP-2014]